MEKLKAELEIGLISSIPSTQMTWRFILRSSGVLNISAEGIPVANAIMAMTVESEMTGKGGITAKFSLDELQMKDLYTPTPLFPYLIKVPSASDSSAKLMISFASKDGVSNVRVDALPLELAWNKPCIQQILGIVIVPKLEAIIDTTDAILLAASLAPNKKKKNEEGEMNFIFEAEAPKIILPDDCSSNSGFLILDSGTLSVRGLMKGEEGMSWKVTMASINAHMTSTLGTSKSPKIVDSIILNLARDGVSSYLIKPFDVSVDVQTFDSSRANMTVDLNISPGIKADLDAVKLARVLDFSKLVVSTFGNDNEPVEKAKSILTRRTESATQGFIPTEISGSHITGSPQKSSDDDRSALDFKMIVTLVVPLVSLDLHYDTVNSNHLVVAATDLYTLVKSRAYDFQASFTMNSLLIEDSSRSASQRELAWTRADNQDENLVSISYISINHRRSPLFRGYGSEIFVAFGSLFMNSDTKTLMHLRPFYEVLLGKRFRAAVNTGVPNMSAKTNLPLRRTSRSQTLQRTVSDAPAVSTKPVGTHILLTLGKIRLEFLKPKAIDNPYILKTRSASPDVFYDRKRSDSRGSITHDSMSPAEDLDSVFALEVSGLFTEVKNMDLIECTVSIHSFEILDTRAISEDYEFRTLFRPDFNLADNLKPSTPCSDAAEITGNSLSSPVANLRSGFPNLSTPKANRGDNLLELTYRQHSKQYSVVDISVGSVTSFFSLDVILELINITVANSLAVVALVATVDTVVSPEVITLPAMQKTVAQINLNSNGEPNSNVMTVCVNAPNMRLILLEDPTIRDTRAVVGRCGVEVKYSREVSMGLMQEVNESLHISVLNAEIFVMTTMMRWNPLQILEPVGMELHYKRSQEKGVVLSTSVALDVDAIDARVSLNDLILARAIASRGLTNSTGDAHVQQNFSSNAAISTTIPPTQITTYNVHISLGEVSLVVVNDFNGQNLPILKLSLNGTTFTADGALQSLNGSGSLILALDYFNPRVFMWEPILEPWFPYLELKTGSDGTKINISQADSECFQISVTGTMLESLMRTYSLLLQADDTNDRTVASAATFQNLLGVPIEIYDGDTKLFDLIDGSTKNLSRLQTAERGHGSGHVRTTAQLTKCFSVAFLDKMKQDRQPILNLPVNISKPQSYQVLPLRPVASESRSPVVEDIYEMERYQPLSGSWKAPFMMNDPPQWATIDYKPRDISDISLPPGGGWEWQGQWTVEVAAQPKRGENFDPETDLAGWEYAANFSAFSSSNKRRGKPQTFDYVRRRRWVRTRVPEFSEDNDGTRPLTLFWDVQLLPTGCRRVLIRSGFQIRNALSFPVLVKLANSVYKSDFELGPIEPDAIFFVPILYASSSSLCVKPSGSNCQWSQLLQCSHSTMDYERSFNIYCSQSPTQSIYFKAIISKVEKSTVVILSPLFNLENRLPCILKYRVVTELSQQSDKLPVPVEEGCLEAGESCLLYHISDAERARISISAGHLGWSQYIYLVGGRKNVVPLGLPTQLGPIGLHVLLRVETGMDSTEQITICSQGALVDRSNLGICVRSVFSDGRELVRISSANNANDTGPASTSIRCVTTDPIAEDIVRLLNFSCKSHRNYIVSVGRHGDFVYVDNNFAWTYLPDFFYGHTSIRTCSSDRKIRFKELMEFEVDRKSIVFVLHDSHEESPPKWISSGGFHKIIEQAIARHVVNNVVIEHHYSIYGIFVDPGVKVILGQNLSMSASSDMYSVFVLPDIFDKLRDQLLFEKSIQSDDASNSWVDGMNGLTLFNYSNETVSFGVRGGEFWSPLMHMKKISSGKGPFEIIDRKTNRSYQLCYSVQSMPGKFHRTNLTTVMPRYCIVNCMEEPIEVRQIGTRRTTYVPSYHTEGWHKAEADKGTQIQIKTNSTVWSLGAVDINEIGSTVFLLPLVDGSNTINADSAEVEIDPVVVHVEVKLAESHENCAVTVIIWREEIGQATAYSVRNDSSQPVVLQQSNVNFSGMRPELISKFELCVPPGKRIPFGWTDPDASSAVTIAIGKNLLSAGRRAAEISFLESGKALRIAGVLGNKEVIMCVTPEGSGKVLHIVDRAEDLKLVPHLSTLSKTPLEHITACLTFRRFGISLVLDRPVRRELFSFYMKKVMTKFSLNEGVNSTEVTVDDFQVDNYSETAVYPVMLYCVKPNPREVEDGDTSAIKFCVVRVNSGASTQHYR